MMPRKRLQRGLKTESRFKWDVFLEIHGDDGKDFSVNSFSSTQKDIYSIQILSCITVVYGSFLIYYIINSKYYLHIGTRHSLFIPFIHGVLEYLKFQIYQKIFGKHTKIEYKLLLPVSLITTLLIYCFSVMFGADLTDNIESTFVFSCFLTSLLLFPPYFYFGLRFVHLLTFREKPQTLMHLNLQTVAVNCIIGAWLGVFVIPLDWDKSWQQWPIPCIIGSLCGFVFGHIYSFLTLFCTNNEKLLTYKIYNTNDLK